MAVEMEIATDAVRSAVEAAMYEYTRVDEAGWRAALEYARSHIEESDGFWLAPLARKNRKQASRDACVELEGELVPAAAVA